MGTAWSNVLSLWWWRHKAHRLSSWVFPSGQGCRWSRSQFLARFVSVAATPLVRRLHSGISARAVSKANRVAKVLRGAVAHETCSKDVVLGVGNESVPERIAALGQCAQHVGGDEPVPVSTDGRLVVDSGECRRRNHDTDGEVRGACRLIVAVDVVECVDEQVGPALVDGAVVVGEGRCGVVEPLVDSREHVGRQVLGVEVAGAVVNGAIAVGA